jgi:hypothetical protein
MTTFEKALENTLIKVDDIKRKKTTYTKPGSLIYLLFGKEPSSQSMSIKCGYIGEFLSKELVKASNNCELLKCGVQDVDGTNMDIDLIWKNEGTKTIHYRELKANIDVDTEKIVSVVERVRTINYFLTTKYPEYTIDPGVLHWSVYGRNCISENNGCLNSVTKVENAGFKLDHFNDLLDLLGHQWSEEEFTNFFREIGNTLRT